MSTLVEQITQIIDLVFYIISLVAYGGIVYIILHDVAPPIIKAQKVTFRMLIGPIIAIIVVVGAIEYVPAMIAQSAYKGFVRSMPYFLEIGDDVRQGIIDSGGGMTYSDPTYLNETTVQMPANVLPENPQPNTYTVKAGDTLSAIANANGVTTDQIRQENGLSGTIEIGQSLLIPNTCTFISPTGEILPCPPTP